MPDTESNNIPADNLVDDDFIGALDDKESWAYFLCNVGDGDSQLVLLPRDDSDRRKAIVVDAYTDKVARLINELTDHDLLIQPKEPEDQPVKDIALVVASHPHHDHISNMPNLFRTHGGRIAEFWDPGFYHPISAYTSLMNELQHRRREIGYAQPTAGLRRWIGGTLVTVLSPAVGLRNRFDSYGTEINDSSISIRIDHPAARKRTRDDQRRLIPVPGGASSLRGRRTDTLMVICHGRLPIPTVLEERGGEGNSCGHRDKRPSEHRRRQDLTPRVKAGGEPGADGKVLRLPCPRFEPLSR